MSSSSSIRHLFYSAFLFGLACGVSLALTPLLIEAAFGKASLGPLAAANALGIVACALPASWLAKHVSPKNALVVFLALYAVFDGCLPFVRGAGDYVVAGVRFFDGACSVGVWICSETLLLAQTRLNEKDKANLTTQYAVWLASGYVGGSVVANVTNAHGGATLAYPVAAAIAVVGALYVAFFIHVPHATTHAAGLADEAVVTNEGEHALPDAAIAAEMPLLTLLGRIRCSVFAAFAYGYFQVAVVTFLPIYLMETKGIAENKVTLLPGIFCLGMLLVSNPVGRLADRYGPLLMMRLLAAIGLCMVLGFVALSDWRPMLAAVFLAGATLAAMSPISLALVGFVVPAHQYSRANGIYNLFYASGILMGPPISGWIFARFGGPAMLEHLTALWIAFAIFAWIHASDDPAHGRRHLALKGA